MAGSKQPTSHLSYPPCHYLVVCIIVLMKAATHHYTSRIMVRRIYQTHSYRRVQLDPRLDNTWSDTCLTLANCLRRRHWSSERTNNFMRYIVNIWPRLPIFHSPVYLSSQYRILMLLWLLLRW